MKIVILGTKARYQRYLPDLPFARAQEPVFLDKDSSEEQILAAAGDAETIFVDAITPVSGRLMERMPRLRLVHSEGVAFDRIDLAAARARGIDVCNNKGCNAPNNNQRYSPQESFFASFHIAVIFHRSIPDLCP